MSPGRRRRKERRFFSSKHQCREGGKQAHENVFQAIDHIKRISSIRPGVHFNFYQCERCGLIHVGRAAKGTVLMYGGWSEVVGETI